ncbi:MAG TPA: efflux RND transporter periplasmic adaptor subunit [Bacteroidales bacterium]|nr:efflux RND transporter periplasmic adaptor subunit [Bacteroidales bacterium]
MKTLKITTLVIGLLAGFTACNSETQKPESEAKTARPVKTILLEKSKVQRTTQYTSTLIPFEEVNTAPAQPGRIEKIYVEAGDHVKKDQVLVVMDRTQLTQAMLQLEDAKVNYTRMETLLKQNSISQQQYDQAKMAADLASSNVNFLKENTTLHAPFSGIITAKYYEDGEVYSGAPNTESGKAAIINLQQISKLKAVVHISENYFPEIKKGMDASFTTDIYPDKVYKGRVYRVYPIINEATRTFKTEIEIDNPKEELRPGMFTRVEIQLEEIESLVVPAIAIVKQEGTNNRFIYVYDNGKAKQIEVEIGKRINDKVEVISPEISEGMLLIVAGQARLMAGDSVTLVE